MGRHAGLGARRHRLHRAIDLREGERPDEAAFAALVRAAVAHNAGLVAARLAKRAATKPA